MILKFLCVNHRQQLVNNPDRAVQAFLNSYETGLSLIAIGLEKDAIAHLGCAFETSEIVLSGKFLGIIDAISLLTSSAASLAKLFNSLDEHEMASLVIDMTEARLFKVAKQFPEYKGILFNQISSLHHFVGDSEEYDFPIQDEKIQQACFENLSVQIH